MGAFQVELSDGRKFRVDVDGDTPPTEADVIRFISDGQKTAAPQEKPLYEREGVPRSIRQQALLDEFPELGTQKQQVEARGQEWERKPLLGEIPKAQYSDADTGIESAAKGVMNVGASVLDFLQSPLGLSLLAPGANIMSVAAMYRDIMGNVGPSAQMLASPKSTVGERVEGTAGLAAPYLITKAGSPKKGAEASRAVEPAKSQTPAKPAESPKPVDWAESDLPQFLPLVKDPAIESALTRFDITRYTPPELLPPTGAAMPDMTPRQYPSLETAPVPELKAAPAKPPVEPPKPATAVESAAKEPWLMSSDELIGKLGKNKNLSTDAGIEPWQIKKKPFVEANVKLGAKLKPKEIAARHKAAIESAIMDGKPVPPEVLADYPDLAKQAKPAPAIPPEATAIRIGKSEGGKLMSGIEYTDPMNRAKVAAAAGQAQRLSSVYSEPLVDRIRTFGGEANKATADMLDQAVSRGQQIYGERLSSMVDSARKASGKLGLDTLWAHRINEVAPKLGIANSQVLLEGSMDAIPKHAHRLAELNRAANLEIGRVGFEAAGKDPNLASGKMQRNMTPLQVAILKGGTSPLKETLVKGLADMNGLDVARVRAFFEDAQRELNRPDIDAAKVERINQDFERVFPRFPTHIKVGNSWEPLIHADLFNYLEQAAQRSSHALGFREQFPVGSTKLAEARANYLSSAKGRNPQGDFDTTIMALQGKPEMMPFQVKDPTSAAANTAARAYNMVDAIMSKLVLTGNFMVNLPETLFGSNAQYFGVKQHLRALANAKSLYPELERLGMVNRSIYDYSFDANHPLSSSVKILSNEISARTMQKLLNEIQETTAATSAHLISKDIMSGELSSSLKRTLPHTLEVMGFTKEAAAKIMQGDPALINQFRTKAASFLTGGNAPLARTSKLAVNRLFNTVFRFQTYPMMKLNQAAKTFEHAMQQYAKGSPKDVIAASELLAKFTLGTTMQGAATALLTSLLYGGKAGLEIGLNEAKDEPAKFLLHSILAGIGGPLYVVARGLERGGLRDIGQQLVNMAFPYTIGRELMDIASRTGQYKDLTPEDAIDKFLSQRIAGGRVAKNVMAVFGLAQKNVPLDASIKAFHRWRRDLNGYSQSDGGVGSATNEQGEKFRMGMKAAVEALKRGEAIAPHLMKALSGEKIVTYADLASALNSRKILKAPDMRELTTDQLVSLKNRVGDAAYDRLVHFDGKVQMVADMLGRLGDKPVIDASSVGMLSAEGLRNAAMPGAVSTITQKDEMERQKKEAKNAMIRQMIRPLR